MIRQTPRTVGALALGFCLTTGACTGTGTDRPPAPGPPGARTRDAGAEDFLSLRRAAREARDRSDPERAAILLERAHREAPQNPVVLLRLAEALAAAGRPGEALDRLEELTALGVVFDLGASAVLDGLADEPRWREVRSAMERNRRPVLGAEPVCEIEAPGLAPEGIDFDPISAQVVLGSFSQGRILLADFDCRLEELTPDRTLGAVAGIRVDPARRVVWATSNREPGEVATSAVVAVDLDTGELVARKPLPAGSGPALLNDLAVAGNGTVYVTETLGNGVLRTCPDCPGLEPWIASPRMPYPNGIAFDRGRDLLYVAHAAGVSAIRPGTGSERRLAVPTGEVTAGADGLYSYRGDLLAIQNQPYHDRIARFVLDASGLRVDRVEVLDAFSSGGMFRSTGFVHDGHLYLNGVPGGVPAPAGADPANPLLLVVPLTD